MTARFKVLGQYWQDGHLVVRVEMRHPDGAYWHIENFTFQGREGLKRKRQTDALGQMLLDDGTVAPSKVVKGPPEKVAQYLPDGRQWLYQTEPPFNNESVLSIIRLIWGRRQQSGWPQGAVDTVGRLRPSAADLQGVEQLKRKVTVAGLTE